MRETFLARCVSKSKGLQGVGLCIRRKKTSRGRAVWVHRAREKAQRADLKSAADRFPAAGGGRYRAEGATPLAGGWSECVGASAWQGTIAQPPWCANISGREWSLGVYKSRGSKYLRQLRYGNTSKTTIHKGHCGNGVLG